MFKQEWMEKDGKYELPPEVQWKKNISDDLFELLLKSERIDGLKHSPYDEDNCHEIKYFENAHKNELLREEIAATNNILKILMYKTGLNPLVPKYFHRFKNRIKHLLK